MVDNRHLWILRDLVPPEVIEDSNRNINGPVYDLNEVKLEIVEHGIFVINQDAREDAAIDFTPPMDNREIIALIQALRHDLHHESEWCLTSARQKVACDAYTIRWNRNKEIEWEHGRKIYVKFGFRMNSAKGLIISIHNSKF